MGLWINVCTGLPRRMDTKVGKIIAWMDGWILEGWGQVLVKWTGKRLIGADRQMDEQTDGGRVRVLDVTNRRAGHAKGRGEGPAQPRGYRPRLDICSGVKWRLARAANLSCHSSWWPPHVHLSHSSKSGGWAANTIGQRSGFILRWGGFQAGHLPRLPSVTLSRLRCAVASWHLMFLCCCKTMFLSACDCLTQRADHCVGEKLACYLHRFRRQPLTSTGFTFC